MRLQQRRYGRNQNCVGITLNLLTEVKQSLTLNYCNLTPLGRPDISG